MSKLTNENKAELLKYLIKFEFNLLLLYLIIDYTNLI